MPRNRTRNLDRPGHNTRKRLAALIAAVGMIAACIIVRYYWGAESANADPPRTTAVAKTPTDAKTTTTQPSQQGDKLRIVATVNRRQITRRQLGRECLRHYGKDVLESLVNKHLIAQECKRRGIAVTGADCDAEIERMAGRFGLPVEQWLKMLKTERGINPQQYAADIVWPTLALRRLAGEQLTVTRQELTSAYETKYGPAVRARLIACKDLEKAKRLHAAAVANPKEFGKLAKEHSDDAPSAAAKGHIQPIRKHGSYEQIEQAAFNMADGDISQVIPAGGQYVILKREGLIPGAQAVNFEQVAPKLQEIVRDGKLRKVAQQIFRQLQQKSQVRNVLNDPKAASAMPGVAALINQRPITVAQLAEECIQRHGKQVLEGTINRTLIELACEKRNVKISEQDINAEITRAAADSVKPKPDGAPDVRAWLQLVTERQGVSEEVYRRDSVWPSVALKKLVGNSVEVTKEDLRKGYEANYGPRVRCRAIVMNNLRRANQVWEMARQKPNAQDFGNLAEQYSCEPSSRALRGEIPPIKKHGGQPLLEKEAFSLKAGELSGIVQTGEYYIILFCEGRTKPTEIDFDEARPFLHEDIYRKKLRLAMAKYFRQLQQAATIDNHLAGTTRRPKKPTLPQRPKTPSPSGRGSG